MKRWFVTRHRGAVDYAHSIGLSVDRVVDHLVPADLATGDEVLGTLPVHLAADVCARGARYFHLSLDLPADRRGLELNLDELRSFGARLEEYRVERIAEPRREQHPATDG